jgi:hypothetical protein
MIRFTQPQSVIEFANNPVVIMSITDNDVILSVRVKADPNYVIKVRVSELRDDHSATTQTVSTQTDLFVKDLTIFDEAIAKIAYSHTNIDTRQSISFDSSKNTITDMLTGGDGLNSIAQQTVAAVGDAMRDVIAIATPSDVYTHEAIMHISQDEIQNPLSVVAFVTKDDVLIGSVALEVSLLRQYSLLANKIDNPKCSFRISADTPTLSVESPNNLLFVYKRELGRTIIQNFDLIAKSYNNAEITFDKSLTNICEIVIVAADASENAYSSGTRFVIKPHNKTPLADAKFIVLRSESGFDLCVKNLFNVDSVTFIRKINNIKTIISSEKIAQGQQSITINDNIFIDSVCQYYVELHSGSNVIKLQSQIVAPFGSLVNYAKPKLSNLTTTISSEGLITSFDIEPAQLSGDASIARTIIKSDASSNLFDVELAQQREAYDHVTLFSVLRIDRDTGEEIDLGVTSSGSFTDIMPTSTVSRNFRYAVYTTKRNPESLLQFIKFVSGSQPYSYYPAIYKHPYALQDGIIVKQDFRSLRHPFVDAAVGLSSIPAVADVTFQPADGSNISISAERISVKSVAITITDQLHETRVGYVVIALSADGKFELVGYVNSFKSRVVIYHNVSIIPDTLTYAIAAVAPDMSVDAFFVGPSLVLT